MHREIRELSLNNLGRAAPGSLAAWVRAVIIRAGVEIGAVPAVSALSLRSAGGHASGLDRLCLRKRSRDCGRYQDLGGAPADRADLVLGEERGSDPNQLAIVGERHGVVLLNHKSQGANFPRQEWDAR